MQRTGGPAAGRPGRHRAPGRQRRGKLADLESMAAEIQADNARLAQLLADSQAQVKQIEKKEKNRRWRWLLYGLIIGGVAGAVAAQ